MDDVPKTKRRMPTPFSMLMIAVVLLVVGGAFTLWMPYQREQSAIRAIQQTAGVVFTETRISKGFRPWVDSGYLSALTAIDYRKVRAIGFDAQITDEELKLFEALMSCPYLSLAHCRVTDDGLKHLLHLSDLESLEIYHTQVTAEGLKQLAVLPALKHLTVTRAQVSQEEHWELAKLLPECTFHWHQHGTTK